MRDHSTADVEVDIQQAGKNRKFMNEDDSLPQQYRKTKNSSHNEKKSLSQNRIEKN
jgi:hypothetical protein